MSSLKAGDSIRRGATNPVVTVPSPEEMPNRPLIANVLFEGCYKSVARYKIYSATL
jgi:hypothetical protein